MFKNIGICHQYIHIFLYRDKTYINQKINYEKKLVSLSDIENFFITINHVN